MNHKGFQLYSDSEKGQSELESDRKYKSKEVRLEENFDVQVNLITPPINFQNQEETLKKEEKEEIEENIKSDIESKYSY